jgi:hypothetical protein
MIAMPPRCICIGTTMKQQLYKNSYRINSNNAQQKKTAPLRASSLRGRLLHDPLHLWSRTSHSIANRRSCCVLVIFPYLLPPKSIFPAQVGHLTVTRRAHQPIANRTHAKAHRSCESTEIQGNLGTAASHIAQSKTAVARHTLWPY